MDLVLHLSPDSLRLLRLEQKRAELNTLRDTHGYDAIHSTLSTTERKAKLSRETLRQLPLESVPYEKTDNPYNRRWRRIKGRKQFVKGNRRRVVPPVSDLRPTQTSLVSGGLKDNTAYITSGYEATGSYATVHTLVAYNGRLCVIKSMNDDDDDLFELVTQLYLFEQLQARRYKHIKVPSIYFVQRQRHYQTNRFGEVRVEKMTDVCMDRSKGDMLGTIVGMFNTDIYVALAHVMKALWHLQRDFQFMHRDLSGSNVFFDKAKKDVTFIDFGMSCINPERKKSAWQSSNQDFFEQDDNTAAQHCTNRSLDVCILIAQMTHANHPWLREEHERMKRKIVETVNASTNDGAKAKLRGKEKFTDISVQDWVPGNLLTPWNAQTGQGDGPHWWLYNMIEFPMEEWYPETLLERLLQRIPVSYWFAIRENWITDFDHHMPKDIRMRIRDTYEDAAYRGRSGVLVQLYGKNKLKIRIDVKELIVNSRDCQRLFE